MALCQLVVFIFNLICCYTQAESALRSLKRLKEGKGSCCLRSSLSFSHVSALFNFWCKHKDLDSGQPLAEDTVTYNSVYLQRRRPFPCPCCVQVCHVDATFFQTFMASYGAYNWILITVYSNTTRWRNRRLTLNFTSCLNRKSSTLCCLILTVSEWESGGCFEEGEAEWWSWWCWWWAWMWTSCLEKRERETRYPYPRWDLVSSVGVGISSLLFTESPGKHAETPRDGES